MHTRAKKGKVLLQVMAIWAEGQPAFQASGHHMASSAPNHDTRQTSNGPASITTLAALGMACSNFSQPASCRYPAFPIGPEYHEITFVGLDNYHFHLGTFGISCLFLG